MGGASDVMLEAVSVEVGVWRTMSKVQEFGAYDVSDLDVMTGVQCRHM